MELTCPCGQGYLIRKVTKNGPNVNRRYCKFPGSVMDNNVNSCGFYSFEDELKMCPCGHGFCRTKFSRGEKFWICPTGNCSFYERIRASSTQLSQTSTPRASSCQVSQSPPSCSGGTISNQTQTPSSTQLSHSCSSVPSNNQKATELLLRALKVTKEKNAAYLEIIEEFVNATLED